MSGITFALRFLIPGLFFIGVGGWMFTLPDQSDIAWRRSVGGLLAVGLGVYFLIRFQMSPPDVYDDEQPSEKGD